jgi:outer membrane protein
MNRSFVLIAALSSALVLPAAAQSTAAPKPAGPSNTMAEPARIAVIAFQVAVAQTNEGQRDFSDLQKKFDPQRQQLKQLSDQVDAMTKQLQSQASTMSPEQQQAQARAIDEKIPLKYGVIGQETVGPGGLSMALRAIPRALEIAAEVRRLCPDAWWINLRELCGAVLAGSPPD